jgi:hypothetical protein
MAAAASSSLNEPMLSNSGSMGATPAEIREHRRLVAKNYRNMYLLPRFVFEEDGSKRKLEAGEFHPQSQLYPLMTPIRDLSDFGVGIGMYFTTTMWFGIMMLVCGIIQSPAVEYFGSHKYDSDVSHDRSYKVFGSAACVNAQRVCMDVNCSTYAGEFHYPDPDVPRFSSDYDAQPMSWRDDEFRYFDDDTSTANYVSVHRVGTELGESSEEVESPSSFLGVSSDEKDKLWVGHRDCKIHRYLGILDLAMIVFLAAMLLVLGWRQNKEAEDLDLLEQTAQDYSVCVMDPNPECTDPDEWKTFFENLFGPVFMVTVCLDNGDLLTLFKQKRALQRELKFEEKEELRYSQKNGGGGGPEEVKSVFKSTMELLGLDPTLEYFCNELMKVDEKIKKELNREKPYCACKVFIIFNEEASQRKCLESMCVGLIPSLLDSTGSVPDHMLFKDNVLAIDEASEPSSVFYENLDVGLVPHLIEQVISWSILCVCLVITYFSIETAFAAGQPVVGAILISLWNSVLPEVNRYLVMNYERHHNTEDMETSFLSKTVVARWFTSSIILYLVGLDHSAQILSPYYIGSIQAVLLADALTSPIIRLMDLGGVFNRYVLAPIAGTDGRAKSLYIGTDYLLAERYTDLAKTVLMSLFFSAIFPIGYWYSAMACFICFWVDKYCILRLFRQKPPAGDRLVRVTRLFTAIVIIVHVIITAHFYYGWPFDDLCSTSDTLNDTGQAIANKIGVRTSVVYKQCNSISSSFLPPVKKEEWFQENGDQYRLVEFYNVIAIVLMCYVCITYLGSDATWSVYSLFYYKHEAVGAPSDILFENVLSGEGYVPQFEIEGESHAITCCQAPITDNLHGGFEFSPYLLNWTASKERTGDETEAKAEADQELTDQEKDAIYRSNNVFFDKTISKENGLRVFGRAKQYIFNSSTSEAAMDSSNMKKFFEDGSSNSVEQPPLAPPLLGKQFNDDDVDALVKGSPSMIDASSKHRKSLESKASSRTVSADVGGGGYRPLSTDQRGSFGNYVDDVTSNPTDSDMLEKLASQ